MLHCLNKLINVYFCKLINIYLNAFLNKYLSIYEKLISNCCGGDSSKKKEMAELIILCYH